MLSAAGKCEEKRRIAACLKGSYRIVPGGFVAAIAPEEGEYRFNDWYRQIAPVLVVFFRKSRKVAVSCESAAIAELLFGKGGLRNPEAVMQIGGSWSLIADSDIRSIDVYHKNDLFALSDRVAAAIIMKR